MIQNTQIVTHVNAAVAGIEQQANALGRTPASDAALQALRSLVQLLGVAPAAQATTAAVPHPTAPPVAHPVPTPTAPVPTPAGNIQRNTFRQWLLSQPKGATIRIDEPLRTDNQP